jgi:ABC-type polysaccharide/polyol phosphate transport system ATPase subunit
MNSPFASEQAVVVRNLGVTYRTTIARPIDAGERSLRFRKARRQVREVRALHDVSFSVPRGSVLGVIGANGAGKSTLLRTIAGIIPPSAGRIEVAGEVSTLLSLGVGFRKTLTGRENVMLGGLAAGRSKREVREQYEAIAQFADIGDFMDMPCRTYSSGMYARLAFAVGVSLDPDILLMDEALSAGDASFKERSAQAMQDLRDRAGTIVIVSHGLRTVQELATHCLWLDHGQVMGFGDPVEVVNEYTHWVHAKSAAAMEEV